EGDGAKESSHLAVGGLGTAAIPDSLETHLVGHVPTVARLDVVERPCDDDPPQFSKLGVQLSLELVAGLGSQLGPAEADDQAADLGEHRDQANGQWQQGGRKMRCREQSEASSMIHRGALSGRVTGSVPSVTSQERRLSFNSPELIQGGTQATPRVKTARISWKSLALARSHPSGLPISLNRCANITSKPCGVRCRRERPDNALPPRHGHRATVHRPR